MATNYTYCGLNILLMFLLIISILTIIVELSIKPSLLQLIFNSTSSDGNNRLQLNDSAERFYGEFSIITTTGSKEANHFKQSNRDRNLRELSNQTKNSNKSNYYYEEQMPVVVYAKTDDNGSGSNSDSDSDSDYRSGVGGVYKDNQYYEYDYPFNKELETSQYYDSADAEGDDYYSSPVGRANANANAVWDDKVNTAVTTAVDAVSGRSFHDNNYNAYYRQWHYATPSTPLHSHPAPAVAYDGKLSALRDSSITQNNRRPPYASYNDDNYYDYLRHPIESSTTITSTALKTYHNKSQETQEMPLLSVLRTLKILWDLYQSLVAAWNSMAIPKAPPSSPPSSPSPLIKKKLLENSTRIRINSKKPGNSMKIKSNKIFNGKNKNSTLNKTKMEPLAKVEPRYKKDVAEANGEREIWRNSRQVKGDYDDSTHTVEQSRYIKGDPLKGYYDFVITEGSYKFWAVFQVGTAILIIYSTFAAIYYSKVNPLTSDYDYADYLGAGRSLSTDNLDFVDDNAVDNNEKSTTLQSWYNWLQPLSGHTIKLVLDAIDKLSLDADGNEYDESETSESNKNKNMKRQVLNMK